MEAAGKSDVTIPKVKISADLGSVAATGLGSVVSGPASPPPSFIPFVEGDETQAAGAEGVSLDNDNAVGLEDETVV